MACLLYATTCAKPSLNPYQTWEVGAIISSFSQIWKLRLKSAKLFTQGHTASRGQTGSTAGLCTIGTLSHPAQVQSNCEAQKGQGMGELTQSDKDY